MNPWVNIALDGSYTISTVFVDSYHNCCYEMAYNTEIRIGANSAVGSNALCKTIDLTGMYDCINPLTGT